MAISEANFLYSITYIRQRLFRFLSRELAKRGIGEIAPSYGDILFVLDQKGTVTMQEVARHTIKDKSTVSSVINKLEAGGYIVKERDAADGRYTNLTLTPKARKLRPVLFEISKEMNEKLFEGFTEEEKQTLFRLMEKIDGNI
jgi:DNA-binding MarR family transcriptional regulator